MKNCRIYPNGEFSIWEEARKVRVSGPPDQPDYLGLSLLPNSHRVALGLSEPVAPRGKRGLKGITRHGARTVRNAAYLLEKQYGGDCLTFLTCTLPPVLESDELGAAREWAEIVRVFVQGLGRLLKAAGLKASYVGCTEIQGKRYQERGGMPLHLHMVFPGRKPGCSWAISSDQFRALWRRAVVGHASGYESASFAASVDTQRVKRSAQGYLGKYMSKGPGQVSAILDDDPGMAEFIPSSWWQCSLNLRRAIGRRITGGKETANRLSRDITAGDSRVEFSREVTIEVEGGKPFTVALVGKLSGEGRAKYCFRPGRIPSILD